MRIEAIHIRNFKALKDFRITSVPEFLVLVGANGSGKSTFFQVFAFLRDCLQSNVRSALQRAGGGFGGVVSRGCANENISIEIKLRVALAQKSRLVTYHLEIGNGDKGATVRREFLRYKRGRYGHPFYFLDFRDGEGFAIPKELDALDKDEELEKDYQTLTAPDILAIKGLGQFERFRAANMFRSLIENWHVSDFHIKDARRDSDAGYAEKLSPDGDNLPLVTQYIFDNHPDIFNRIISHMKRHVPGLSEVETRNTEDGQILLCFRDSAFSEPFAARYVSDGTIKMFAYLVLLYDAKPSSLLCVEEPENQLYPILLTELAEEFQLYARRGGQVMVATHSPDFVNAAPLESVFWLEKTDGYSIVHAARDYQWLRSLHEEGETIGALWKRGLFGTPHP